MYELYGDRQNPSSRFRDLIDLVLIVTTSELDAAPIIRALHSERTRRLIELPTRLESLGPQWPAGYSAYARRTMLGRTLLQLDAALGAAGDCLNPLLDGTRTAGRWAPGRGWTD